jgi:C4-dicarboxylate-specific signal transduction histidine kinase
MLGELTASIAHEVNQPLAAIVSNGAASLRWLSREAPDLTEARIAIERMIEDGQRASEIVSRTRMMSSRRAQAKAPVDINGVIDDAALFLRHEFASRKTALRLDLAPRLPPALGDKVQLHQVMVNLMMNALQAMDHAPAPRELAVRAFADEGAVKVEVSDTGDGIADDAAARLFKAFYTTKENGMGMGLSICATIIEAHGGRISARNNDGRGSTFSFSLPAMDAPADHTKV